MKTTFLKKGMAFMFALMLATVFSVGNTYAQKCNKDGEGCKGGGQGCGVEKFDFIPDLTKEQKDNISKLHLNLMKECTGLHNLINEKKAHIITVTTGDKADVNEAGKTIDEMFALKAEVGKKHVAFKMAVRGLLTEDQKTIFDMKMSKCCQPDREEGKVGCGGNDNDGPKCGQGDGNGCKGGGKCGKGDGKGCKGEGKCGKGDGEGKGCKGGNPDMDKKSCPHHQEQTEEPKK
jgi:Spy/CpxP family protein refolding chaperone